MLSSARVIRHPELVEEFERVYALEHPLDYAESLAIYEALWEHARRLGALPSDDPLEGIDVDIRLAQILNVRRAD